MFGNGIYLSVFYCLCYEMDISIYMSEDQVSEERDIYLNEEEDIILDAIREKYCGGIAEEGDNKKKIRALRWEVYVKEDEGLIKRDFYVFIPHPKGGGSCLDLCEGSYHRLKVAIQSYWTTWVLL